MRPTLLPYKSNLSRQNQQMYQIYVFLKIEMTNSSSHNFIVICSL